MHSKLIDFYYNSGSDNCGRKLEDIWRWSYDQLEHSHDYIQWLFPLQSPSRFNPSAPILNEQDITLFIQDKDLTDNLITSFRILLDFWGFIIYKDESNKITINKSSQFKHRSSYWLCPYNHNYQRISRVLICLNLLELQEYSDAFYIALKGLYDEDFHDIIGDESFMYWKNAFR